MDLLGNEKRPLAERSRPTALAEFVGQTHVISRLTNILAGPRLPSLLFFGPPGCGKSTLALILARAKGRPYVRVSAPEAGLAALRDLIKGKEILILDELHRFSKAQQDFFLPLLETGEIVLLATTTENPSFSVTRQLLSRLHVFRLRPLSHAELLILAERGAKEAGMDLAPESLEVMAMLSSGDGRTLLNLVEFAAALPEAMRAPEELKKQLPEALARGDRDGDSHYELASAMIKSIRGSDPDAALYYLACLLESGEDPRFCCRRLMISASEDVGLADPMALPLAVSAAEAVEKIGMPEGFIPLAQTVVYLALAPKSNSSYAAYLAAKKDIMQSGVKPVPLHLRNPSTRLQREWGFGKGYKYPHAYPDAWVDQEYMPEELAGRQYYTAKDQGLEPRLAARLARLRKGRS
ncbi:replication-associated recombination protein A [Solidesulfovibrio sp.]|uniref:replication-associated recombination protein A n=1 Tax=Solidesulfovibrio sp. TaxID=2910990 RepID=UPI000ED74474|nr:replication-associated recombination protein A [Solidesulfovibrio sp.]MEA5089900.1 replication-associated recombination protein A [Solidesulfovibrio sp.]HCR13178.1 recombinase RarA [Desulfovibrio sp.]HML61677.1 replication-associated recombination protein A [Solidesulfovibrio sp.]